METIIKQNEMILDNKSSINKISVANKKPKATIAGNNINSILKNKGLSQNDLAKLSGLTTSHISKIINNKRLCVSLPIAFIISEALNKSVADVFMIKTNLNQGTTCLTEKSKKTSESTYEGEKWVNDEINEHYQNTALAKKYDNPIRESMTAEEKLEFRKSIFLKKYGSLDRMYEIDERKRKRAEDKIKQLAKHEERQRKKEERKRALVEKENKRISGEGDLYYHEHLGEVRMFECGEKYSLVFVPNPKGTHPIMKRVQTRVLTIKMGQSNNNN